MCTGDEPQMHHARGFSLVLGKPVRHSYVSETLGRHGNSALSKFTVAVKRYLIKIGNQIRGASV